MCVGSLVNVGWKSFVPYAILLPEELCLPHGCLNDGRLRDDDMKTFVGDERIRGGFLLFPLELEGEERWFMWTSWVERFCAMCSPSGRPASSEWIPK